MNLRLYSMKIRGFKEVPEGVGVPSDEQVAFFYKRLETTLGHIGFEVSHTEIKPEKGYVEQDYRRGSQFVDTWVRAIEKEKGVELQVYLAAHNAELSGLISNIHRITGVVFSAQEDLGVYELEDNKLEEVKTVQEIVGSAKKIFHSQ